jgi:uncharacterized membrane protein YdbT with pleckstrin-like domain
MSLPKNLLTADEDLLLELRPHWVLLLPHLAVTLGVLAFSLWLTSIADIPYVAQILVLAALVPLTSRTLIWYFTIFAVTSERLIVRSGVLSKKGIEIPLDRINTVFFSQSVLERVLGAGDLSIESASEQGRQTFENVRSPANVQSVIYRAREGFDERARRRSGEALGAAVIDALGADKDGTPTVDDNDDMLDEISRAHQLLVSGAITQEEFDRLKQRLLGNGPDPSV